MKPSHSDVLLIAVGGGAGNVVDGIVSNPEHQAVMQGLTIAAVESDTQILARRHETVRKILLGGNRTGNCWGSGFRSGTGGDPKLGRLKARQSTTQLLQLIGERKLVLITCCLGGGTGSGATPFIAQLARFAGSKVFVWASSPFEMEGATRMRAAIEATSSIRNHAHASCCFSHQSTLHMYGGQTPLLDAFKGMNILMTAAILRVVAPASGNRDLRRVLPGVDATPEWSSIVEAMAVLDRQLSDRGNFPLPMSAP